MSTVDQNKIEAMEHSHARGVDVALPNVLLVDDQPARLLTYESILEGVGVNCVRAHSGKEALGKLLKQSFAVILLDVVMPEMDGFETASLIRQHPRFEHAPIIFVTGLPSTEINQLKMYEAGAIDYIAVPLVPEILRSKVALLVELYKRRTELERLNRELEQARAALEKERNVALESNEAALSAELRDTRLLRDLAAKRVDSESPQPFYDDILEAAMTIARADGGTIQMLDETARVLTFAAIKGIERGLWSQFERVDAGSGSPCGLALARGTRCTTIFDDPALPDPDGSLRAHFEFGFRCGQSTPLISRSGRVLGMFSTHWKTRVELSERELRLLDLLARQAADVIERILADTELRKRELELRESARHKDEFIAMLAHELRNPLVPIRNGIELLKNARARPELVDSVRPMMERQIAHMVRLIDDLLDVARISAGKIELQRQRVSVSSIVTSAVEANRAAIDAARLELKIEIAEPEALLDVDPTRVAQVISNILQNAAKFTPAGGQVRLSTRLSEIHGSQKLVLSIADTGIGIAAQDLPRVFDLFAQSTARTRVHKGGLGIGLSISRRLIEMHDGSLVASSAGENQGSEFVITLPTAQRSNTTSAAPPLDANSLNGVRVLIIDDNQDAADSMALLVQLEGARAVVAYSALQGIEFIDQEKPEAVLLDIGMPGLNGYEACKRIRAQHGDSIALIAVSGWGQEADKKLAMGAGFDAHLTKPADPEALARTIARLVHPQS